MSISNIATVDVDGVVFFLVSMNNRFIYKSLFIDPLCLRAINENKYMQNSLHLLVCYFGLVVMTPEIHVLSNIIMGLS